MRPACRNLSRIVRMGQFGCNGEQSALPRIAAHLAKLNVALRLFRPGGLEKLPSKWVCGSAVSAAPSGDVRENHRILASRTVYRRGRWLAAEVEHARVPPQ